MLDNFYEECYEMCQEAIDPHILAQDHGGCCITRHSLIPSVVESLEYLIEFWIANRDKDNIDLCGVDEA